MTVTDLDFWETVLTWVLVSIPPQGQKATFFSPCLGVGGKVWEKAANAKLRKETIKAITK